MARRWSRPSPLVLAAAACLLLAIASLAFPSGPTYDPYSWLIWGREIAHLELTLRGTGTSWKPLPAFIDAVLTPLGGGAANGWLVVARAGAMFAVVMAVALAWRLAPSHRRLAGIAAGASVLLTTHWINRNGVGGAEGLGVAFGLLAVYRHLDDKRRQAFWLIVAASLIRVEMWPFALGYGCWLWWRGEERVGVVLGWLLIPLMWFGGDYIGSGSATTAASLAHRPVHGSLATAANPAQAVLNQALQMLPPAAWVAIVAALVWAAVRRNTAVLILAGCAALWTAVVLVMTLRGYPGEDRFFFQATAIEAVLAGVGCAVAASWVRARRVAPLAVAALFAVGAVAAAQQLPGDIASIDQVADMDSKLVREVENAGGAAAVMRCGAPHTTWFTVSALAYDLDVSPTNVHSGARSVQLPAPPCRVAVGSPQPAQS